MRKYFLIGFFSPFVPLHGQLQQCQQSTYFTLAAIVASKKELLMIYNQIKNECAENTTSLAPCYAITFLLHDLMH